MKVQILSILRMFVMIALLALAGAARAQVSFSFTVDTLTVKQGQQASYFATIANDPLGTTENLNGLDVVGLDSSLILDDSPFFTNFPAVINPGESFTHLVFNVNVPLTTTIGTYSALVNVNNGVGPITGQIPFTVNVDPATTTAPEPVTFALVMIGGIGLVRVRRMRQR